MGSGKVEAIEMHDLVPRGREVTHKRLLRVVTRVDFRDGSELGVRAEDEVYAGAGPLQLARLAFAPLENNLGSSLRLIFEDISFNMFEAVFKFSILLQLCFHACNRAADRTVLV